LKRFSLMAAIGLLALALVVPSTVAAAPQRNALLSGVPVTGALSDGGTFVGNLTIDGITRTATGALQFAGNLTGIATPAGGSPTAIDQDFTAVLGSLTGAATGKCEILHLDLGPLFLDLLGLQVDLSEIVLNIDAVPGAGNLLGNLLCAVVGLLDGGPATALNNLLAIINRILG
jgi:hypothetical protein